jgi:Amidohydrolase
VIAAQAAFPLVRSVRHKPGGPVNLDQVGRYRTLMSDDTWRRGYAMLERYGPHFDLQTPWWNLHEAVRLSRDFPRTTIVLNHAGLPSDRSAEGLQGWHAAMAAIAPELTARMLADPAVTPAAQNVTIGDCRVIERGAVVAGVDLDPRYVSRGEAVAENSARPVFVDHGNLDPVSIPVGTLSEPAGWSTLSNFKHATSTRRRCASYIQPTRTRSCSSPRCTASPGSPASSTSFPTCGTPG